MRHVLPISSKSSRTRCRPMPARRCSPVSRQAARPCRDGWPRVCGRSSSTAATSGCRTVPNGATPRSNSTGRCLSDCWPMCASIRLSAAGAADVPVAGCRDRRAEADAAPRISPDSTTRQLTDIVRTALRPGQINLQRYTADQGGYPYWHCEQTPADPNSEMLHRVLLWTIYLNDGFDEGETEFFHQHRKIVPAGRRPSDRADRIHAHPSRQPAAAARQVHRHQLGPCSSAPKCCSAARR